MRSKSYNPNLYEMYEMMRDSIEALPTRIIYPPLNTQQQRDLDDVYLDFKKNISRDLQDSEADRAPSFFTGIRDLAEEGMNAFYSFTQKVIEKVDDCMQRVDQIYPGLSSIVTSAVSYGLCTLIATLIGPVSGIAAIVLQKVVEGVAGVNDIESRNSGQNTLLQKIECIKDKQYFREMSSVGEKVIAFSKRLHCHPAEILSSKLPKEILVIGSIDRSTEKLVTQLIALQRENLATKVRDVMRCSKIIKNRIVDAIDSLCFTDNTNLIQELKGAINTESIKLARQTHGNNALQQAIAQEKTRERIKKRCMSIIQSKKIMGSGLKSECIQKINEIVDKTLKLDLGIVRQIAFVLPATDAQHMKIGYAMKQDLLKMQASVGKSQNL